MRLACDPTTSSADCRGSCKLKYFNRRRYSDFLCHHRNRLSHVVIRTLRDHRVSLVSSFFSLGYRCQRLRQMGAHMSKTTAKFEMYHEHLRGRNQFLLSNYSPAPSQYLQRRGVRTYRVGPWIAFSPQKCSNSNSTCQKQPSESTCTQFHPEIAVINGVSHQTSSNFFSQVFSDA